MENVYKFVEISDYWRRQKMKKFSCETHIDHALDMFVAECEDFPIMDKLNNNEKLSTKCDYCEEQAIYIVSSK